MTMCERMTRVHRAKRTHVHGDQLLTRANVAWDRMRQIAAGKEPPSASEVVLRFVKQPDKRHLKRANRLVRPAGGAE